MVIQTACCIDFGIITVTFVSLLYTTVKIDDYSNQLNLNARNITICTPVYISKLYLYFAGITDLFGGAYGNKWENNVNLQSS